MRFTLGFIFLILAGLFGIAVWNNPQGITEALPSGSSFFTPKEVTTFEASFSCDQIVAANQQRLLSNDQYSLGTTAIELYPYLYMEVKYLQRDKTTSEGVVLWSLEDGEMVLDTDLWQTTHGFQDCLLASADRADFKVINTLARLGGVVEKSVFEETLYEDPNFSPNWIKSALSKYLIVFFDGEYRLHFQNPRFLVLPQTKVYHSLVTKPVEKMQFIAKKFTVGQIQKMAKAVFGSDFTIRRSQEVYLPVYSIQVNNPDGSHLESHWNAVSGKVMEGIKQL